MKVCRQCRRPLPPGHAGGNCPACVFDSALSDDAPEFVGEPQVEDTLSELGDYEILGEIGRGGTSVVYRARQRRLNRIVALKTLHGSALTSRDAFARLQTEAQAIARLDHPHIVPLYEVGRHAGTHFLTLRFFKDGSLAQALKQRRFTAAEAARILATAARAVHHAHSRGVLHRDLKPSNFLLDEQGAPHVADFGLAKLADGDSSLTLSTSVLGTPAYMAPEQATGNAKDAGTPADIYALGAVLFELLTGRAPFLGKSALEVLRLVADAEPPRPTSLVPGLDRDLEAVCLRCLEKDPARRYASAAALAEDLDRWLQHEPLRIRPSSPGERALKWVRRRPVIAGLGAALFAAVILGAAGILWQYRRAVRAAEVARTNELAARQNAYLTEINLANQAAEKKDWQYVRKILERSRPGPGEPDLRGWEWRYLWNISRTDAEGRFVPGTNRIWSMAALEDGRTVALGEVEGGFSLWDVVDERQVFRLPGTNNQVRHPTIHSALANCRVAVVPGAGLLAFTDCQSPTEGFVHLWDVARQQIVRSMPVPGMPRHLAVSPNGRRVACSLMAPDTRTLVFDVGTGELVATLDATFGANPRWNTLAFTADGRALSLEDVQTRSLRVVEVATGRDLHRFPLGHDYQLNASFSPDGHWLVTGAGWVPTNRVVVWDLQTGERKHELPAVNQTSIHFDATGQRLIVGLSVWRVPEFTLEREFDGMDPFFAGLLLPDGDTLLTTDKLGGVFRWSLKSPPMVRGGRALCDGPPAGGDWFPGGDGLLLVFWDGTVRRARPPRFGCEPVPELGSNVASLAFIPERHQLAVTRRDGSLSLHADGSLAELTRFNACTNPLIGMGISWVPKAGVLAVLSSDQRLETWDPQTQTRTWDVGLMKNRESTRPTADGVIWQLQGHGRLAAFDLVRKEVLTRQLDDEPMERLAVSADGRWLAITAQDGPSRLMDTRIWKTVSRFQDADISFPRGVTFWPDEPRILFAGGQVVDLATRRTLLYLAEGLGLGWTPYVSGDGSSVVIAGEVYSLGIHIWWAPSWEQIHRTEADERR